MNYGKLAFCSLFSAALLIGCGGDDAGGTTPVGERCSETGDCVSGAVCEETILLCTDPPSTPMAESCMPDPCPAGSQCQLRFEPTTGNPRAFCFPESACGTGDTHFYVVNLADIGQADPAGDPDIVQGFNLDGRISDEDDAVGCFKPDYTSPPPDNERGVDNQLGPILAALGGSFDVAGSIADALADGSLILLFEVEKVDDLTNDSCVTLNLYVGELQAGVEMPELDASGRIASGQTFDINTMSLMGDGSPLVSVLGQIRNGRLRAGPVDLTLSFDVSGAALALNIRKAEVRFNTNDGMVLDEGIIGGELDIDETITAITMASMDVPETLARSILEGQADLNPDASGQCQAVSMGLIFEAVTAVRGNPPR